MLDFPARRIQTQSAPANAATKRLAETSSILVHKKQSSAVASFQTMGSFSLKEVLKTIGTTVSSRNTSISE
jgi:hypothetical protein